MSDEIDGVRPDEPHPDERASEEASDQPPRRASLRGDETELFRAYHARLVRTVQGLVNTSADIVDDACAFAWVEFVGWQPDRDRSWQGWLVRTAQREAWRLHAKEAAHWGFVLPETAGVVVDPPDPRDRLAQRTDLRAALDLLAAVPERRREAKALSRGTRTTRSVSGSASGTRV